MKRKNHKISVIIPVYNGGEKFRSCLKNLLASQPSPEEIIVVFDGGTAGEPELKAEGHNIRFFSLPPPAQGPAKARNIGAGFATGDILFFVDADVTVHRDSIGMVRNFFKENKDVEAVIGSYDDAPLEANFLSQYKNLFHHYIHQNARSEASTFWGACGAIRRDVFFSTGGFDERFTRSCIEDIEYGYRLKKHGYGIRLLKELQVKHLKEWRFRNLLFSDVFDRAIPWTRLLVQEGEIRPDLNLRVSDRFSCALVFGVLFSAPLAFIWGWALVALSLFLTFLLILNRDLYFYLMRCRGPVFALKSSFFHWFYLFYSGLAFMVGRILCLFESPKGIHEGIFPGKVHKQWRAIEKEEYVE